MGLFIVFIDRLHPSQQYKRESNNTKCDSDLPDSKQIIIEEWSKIRSRLLIKSRISKMGQITRLMMTEIANLSDIPRIQDCWFSPHQISLMSQHSEPENLHSEYLVRWLPAPSSQSEPLLLLFASQAEMLPKYRSSRITRSGQVLEWDCRSS